MANKKETVETATKKYAMLLNVQFHTRRLATGFDHTAGSGSPQKTGTYDTRLRVEGLQSNHTTDVPEEGLGDLKREPPETASLLSSLVATYRCQHCRACLQRVCAKTARVASGEHSTMGWPTTALEKPHLHFAGPVQGESYWVIVNTDSKWPAVQPMT